VSEETATPAAPSVPAMTGMKKASVLLIALGADASAQVMKHLSQDEVEQLTWEMARIQQVDPKSVQSVMEEFRNKLIGDDIIERAGLEYVRDVLERAVGTEKAKEILSRLGRRPSSRPFEQVRSLDPAQLLQILQSEHPQTIALVISHLSATNAAIILSGLSPVIQADVAWRVASMGATLPDIAHQVEQVIIDRLESVEAQDVTTVGGALAMVEILNHADRSTERTILEGLSASDPALADAIKEKMFVFEDILALDNRTIQIILREVSQEDLRLALKGVNESLRESVFRNVSERAAETLREDIELMGPVRVKDVEAAQKKIVSIVRQLEEAGEISVRNDKDNEIIV
jgi:flagellar motor switch protein FliG